MDEGVNAFCSLQVILIEIRQVHPKVSNAPICQNSGLGKTSRLGRPCGEGRPRIGKYRLISFSVSPSCAHASPRPRMV